MKQGLMFEPQTDAERAQAWRDRYDDGTYPDGFWAYLAVHMDVYRMFVKLALERNGVASSDGAPRVLLKSSGGAPLSTRAVC